MQTETKTDVQRIREAFDRLAEAMSTDRSGLIDRLPAGCGDAWDRLLDAITKAEGKR